MAASPAPLSFFLRIPQELTEHILKFCHPTDIARFSATCRPLHDIVYSKHDQAVWREAFLAYPFDDLRLSPLLNPPGTKSPAAPEIDWRSEVQRRTTAELTLCSEGTTVQAAVHEDRSDPDEPTPIHDALHVVAAAVRTALAGSTGKSATLEWVSNTLARAPLLARCADSPAFEAWKGLPESSSARQLVAQLLCLLALEHEQDAGDKAKTRIARVRSASRCYVYDLRRYRDETLWGPYRQVTSDAARSRLVVNWEHMRHIQNVVLLNLRDFPGSWMKVWPEFGPQLLRPYSAPGSDQRKPWDWAGVEGKWRRVVCFMDYRDLFTFNFSSLSDGPLNPAFFNEDFTEAVRIMEVDLTVVDPSEPPPSEPFTSRHESNLEFDDAYPEIHFTGKSRGVHSGLSKMTGSVRMLRGGTVRWNFYDQVISYDDNTNRWSAEALQVGPVGSAMGLGGIWTVAVHEEVGDPAGPFWMWKCTDSIPEHLGHVIL